MPGLSGQVALITGGSQGVGRGIALSLGERQATVYITGRNPELLASTAAAVSQRGGKGIALRCDHADDSQVESAVLQIQQDHGRLDILVNNVWGGYEAHPNGLGMSPFWKMGLEDWDGMFERGLRAHFVTNRIGVPLMLTHPHGLIVNTIAWLQGKYLLNLYYDVAKNAVVRMTYGMALELKKHGITAVALAPGFVRTERVMAAHSKFPFDLGGTESPEYIGRAVAHLAADPENSRYTGQALSVAELARSYGFTDVDGRQPPAFVMPEGMALD